MKISSEFSKYAPEYGTYNLIQEKVAKKLLSGVKHKSQNILDLGCGSGSLCKKVDWEYDSFLGVDFAQGMLDLHPSSSKTKVMFGDFNDKNLFENLLMYKFDYLFSSSALQWASDIEGVFKNIQSLNIPMSLAIFTSNTFHTLFKTAGLEPILKEKETLVEIANKYLDVAFEVVSYKLEFSSTREMFRYIKKSGVSSSRNVLSYTQTKRLMKEYPLSYLEFEVLFIRSK